jgi:adenosylmethionine-8-amino-7-oxononanoate aminotransferase
MVSVTGDSLLGPYVDDDRPRVISQRGPLLETINGTIVDTSGGGHACGLSNLGDENFYALLNRAARRWQNLSGRHFATESSTELATVVAQLVGEDGVRVFFVSSGTEAFEFAIQLAYLVHDIRGHRHRREILGLDDSYHGMSIGAISAGGHAQHRERLAGALIGWRKLRQPHYSGHQEEGVSISAVGCGLDEDKLQSAAAVVLEPAGGTTSGALQRPPQYLASIRTVTRSAGCLLIADEVITGFWRTGEPFMMAPPESDIAISGKWLSMGMAPICAVIVSSEICAELRESMREIAFRLTYANGSLSSAVALEVQNFLSSEGLAASVRAKGQFFASEAREHIRTSGVLLELRGLGLMWGVERIVSDADTALNAIKDYAHRHNVIAMCGKRRDPMTCVESVHLFCTPAMDATIDDLKILAEKAVDVMVAGVGNVEG